MSSLKTLSLIALTMSMTACKLGEFSTKGTTRPARVVIDPNAGQDSNTGQEGQGGEQKPETDTTGEPANTPIPTPAPAKPPVPTTTTSPAAFTGCKFSFDEGGTIALSLPAEEIQTTFFGKPLDISRLKAVGAASARSTFDFMAADGVDALMVRSANDNTGCLLFGSIPQAEGATLKMWTDLGDAAKTVLGLFLPRNRVAATGRTRPVIMLRADTNRYTLVHEYMHFTYNRVREARGYSDQELVGRMGRHGAAFQAAVSALPNEAAEMKGEKLHAAADALNAFGKTMTETLENFALEEMSIEAVMQDADKAGLLSHVQEYDRVNSRAYVAGSAVRAVEILDGLAGLGDAFQVLLTRDGDLARAADAGATAGLLKKRVAEIKAMNARYGRPVASLNGALVAAQKSVAETPSCGREELWKKATGSVKIPKIKIAL